MAVGLLFQRVKALLRVLLANTDRYDSTLQKREFSISLSEAKVLPRFSPST